MQSNGNDVAIINSNNNLRNYYHRRSVSVQDVDEELSAAEAEIANHMASSVQQLHQQQSDGFISVTSRKYRYCLYGNNIIYLWPKINSL